LAGDAPALRARMREDGYLLLRRYLDRDAVLAARREVTAKLDAVGLVDRRFPVEAAIFSGSTSGVTAVDRVAYAKDLRTGPALKALAFSGPMLRFYTEFLGGDVLPLNYVWVRNVRVGGATGCHFDWVYMGRGTRNLYTSSSTPTAGRRCSRPTARSTSTGTRTRTPTAGAGSRATPTSPSASTAGAG
jgi:hypothetical protein